MIEMAVSLLRSAMLPLLYPLPSEKKKKQEPRRPNSCAVLAFCFKGQTSSHYLFICVLLSAFMIAEGVSVICLNGRIVPMFFSFFRDILHGRHRGL